MKEYRTTKSAIFVFLPRATELQEAPWGQPLITWREQCPHVAELPQGVSRHPVAFLNCHGSLFAVKEMPSGAAEKEYDLLKQIEKIFLPVVAPAGYVQLKPSTTEPSYLVTFYLESSIPYRILFMNPTSMQSRSKLLDAMAGLLVQIHLSGVFWGDCSLSNTLFRHDAGTLQAYMVDAESAEMHPSPLMPSLRYQDLQIAEENFRSELLELAQSGTNLDTITVYETGASLRQRYHNLWNEITREEIIHPSENFKIQERIRSINNLGYSVRDVAFRTTENGDLLRLKITVADRNFHGNQLFSLTGLEAEEMQARKLLNEIMELKATLGRERNEDIPIEAAAYQWYTQIYLNIVEILRPLVEKRRGTFPMAASDLTYDPLEMYCQVLEHKWFMSERAQHDVGHLLAVEDYLKTMLEQDLHSSET
jgi:hypothetical protein